MKKRSNILNPLARFALFALSYLPLFFLLFVKQIITNWDSATQTENYWLLLGDKWYNVFFFSCLLLISAIGMVGTKLLLKNLKNALKDGVQIKVVEVKDKSGDSIGYIATYIIPFLFVDFKDLFTIIGVGILLFVICMLYLRSTLIVINPILNCLYSLYEISYTDGEKISNGGLKVKNCILLTKISYLEADDVLTVSSIGQKLFIGKQHEN